MTQPTRIVAEISVGELIDKITILEIKSERIDDPAKLANVRYELNTLNNTLASELGTLDGLNEVQQALKSVNERLWELEDDIRDCERRDDFGADFIAAARAIYRTNDERAALKMKLNQLAGSSVVEEKSYGDY